MLVMIVLEQLYTYPELFIGQFARVAGGTSIDLFDIEAQQYVGCG
jgi:hypothetical protein